MNKALRGHLSKTKPDEYEEVKQLLHDYNKIKELNELIEDVEDKSDLQNMFEKEYSLCWISLYRET